MLARDYKLRVFIVFIFFLFLFAVIVVRLFLIQVRQKEFFKVLARHQYETSFTLNPSRALIYDRSEKVPVALNRQVYSAFIVPHQLIEPKKTKRFLKRYYPDVYRRLSKYPDRQFLWVDRKLTSEKYDGLNGRKLKDIQFIYESQRFYPFASMSQLIGCTDLDNNGISGIELEFTRQLSGEPTCVNLEQDARSGFFYFEKKIQKKGIKGTPIVLTIDSMLQSIAYQELAQTVQEKKAKSGSVVIINPDDGHVLAMVNYPSFDPNQTGVVDLELMKNNVASECYEPGSVLKPFCALAVLEEGVVDYDEPINCEGRFGYVNGVKVENPTISLLRILAENDNHLPFCDVVCLSSNVGMAKVVTRLGPDFYKHLCRLGFGEKTGIQFPGERDGFVNPPEQWSRPSLVVMSFGYEVMVTLLQLARAFCVVANGGYSVQPTILKDSSVIKRKKLYKDKTVNQVKNILEQVCRRIQIPDFRIMGKTGTARCVKDGKYSQTAHNYTFAGIVEKDSYRRVIVTFIKEPERSSWAMHVTMPIFENIAKRMIVYDKMSRNLS